MTVEILQTHTQQNRWHCSHNHNILVSVNALTRGWSFTKPHNCCWDLLPHHTIHPYIQYYTYIHTVLYINTLSTIHTYIRTYSTIHTVLYIHIYIHTYSTIHTVLYIRTYIYTVLCIHTYSTIHTYIQYYAYIHTVLYIHTYSTIHTYIHTVLVVRSNSANAWRASKYMNIGKKDDFLNNSND